MIVIEEYNLLWKHTFEKLRSIFSMQLAQLPHNIQHVGSTSVPGLCAKPVIDIDIIVPDKEVMAEAIRLLEVLGYWHVGDLGIPAREVLKRKDSSVPYSLIDNWPAHNLYICIDGSDSVKNHLALRDYLLNVPEAVKAYGKLKMELARQHPNDMESYVSGKTNFILSILKLSGFDETSLHLIAEQNKVKS
jgi:GrpB-like predicted nucleotidyltransferase (UPF0157 family)